MMPEDNSSKTNKSNGLINKSKKKDKKLNKKNIKKICTPGRLSNSTE